jgi:flagellar protein FliO/FliZ
MNGASTVALFARLTISLAVVLGLMFVLAHVLRRRGLVTRPARGASNEIEVVARRGLGRNAAIAVVRAAGRGMVLGVTETQVTLLADVDVEDLDLATHEDPRTGPLGTPAGAGVPGTAWKTGFGGLLDAMRERTVRKGS